MTDFIMNLAEKFAPVYRASSKEKCYLVELYPDEREPRVFRAYPPWNPFVYFSAVRLDPREDNIAYEINYFTIWDWDKGINGHQWDTERTAILVQGPLSGDKTNPDAFRSKDSYYAAHEGALRDKSGYHACVSEGCGVTVYWSCGKHASYQDPDECIRPFEAFKSPGYESKPGEYTLVDIGTHKDPKVQWVLYDLKWDRERNKTDPLCRKLKTRTWGRKTWTRIRKDGKEEEEYEEEIVRKKKLKKKKEKKIVKKEKMKKKYRKKEELKREDDVSLLQEYLGLPKTGEMDVVTLRKAENVDPYLFRNIQEFSQPEFSSILQSELRGPDIDLIAKAHLSRKEIEEITKENIRGSALKKYIKERSHGPVRDR